MRKSSWEHSAVGKRGRGIGDCESAQFHPSYCLWFDHRREAQTIADRLCKRMGWVPWIVEFTEEETTRLMGRASKRKGRIKLHLIGETVGCLIHELAHRKGYKHDEEFQATQERLLEIWDTEIRDSLGKIRESTKDFSPVSIDDGFPSLPASEKVFTHGMDEYDSMWEIAHRLCEDAFEGMVTMVHLGTVLAREKMNTTKNIQDMVTLLKHRGVRVVTGGY